MLRRIHLYTTPYYILYKGEKLIYTEKFLFKTVLYRQKAPDKVVSPILIEKSHTDFYICQGISFEQFHITRNTLYLLKDYTNRAT